MGIPKFYVYVLERYPCICERLKSYQIPEFDNLYLDMNGIIHTCSHPDDSDVHFRISKTHFTQQEIFQNVCHYVEILFRIIQPQRLLYIAFDGVTPKAKMNQQRGRRFKVAQTNDSLGINSENTEKDSVFDTNCITPGTSFMKDLNDYMENFVNFKISTDELWQRCKVVYSRCEVPGEGEHKIMEYIRYMRAQPDYCPNTRHCLYGLDADLITLSMCSHEPYFSLLREEVTFGKKQKIMLTPEETAFYLLHISLLRDYMEHEFSSLKDKITFPFDIEKIIDDWILMTLLIGNDFIPNLPGLYILNGALERLYKTYIEVLPMLDGYINEAGILKLDRFEIFLEKLAQVEIEPSFKHVMDMTYVDSTLEHKLNRLNVSPENQSTSAQNNLENCTVETNNLDLNGIKTEECNIDIVECKRRYYTEKHGLESMDEHSIRILTEKYVSAIQWNLHYYYHGCCSWSWYYPYHYAPFISDIKNIKDLKLTYEIGNPLLPLQHLLALLPPESRSFLPKSYQWLVTDEKSPIIHYYPKKFKCDQNGKMHDWEAVVLIPFIDDAELIKGIRMCPEKLTLEDQKRNVLRNPCVYTYTKEDLGAYIPLKYFSPFDNHAKSTEFFREETHVARNKLIKGLCPGIKLDIYYPGFYTLRYIKHTASFETVQMTNIKKPSITQSIVLRVSKERNATLDLSKELLGKNVFVNWPHLIEAYVIGVSDDQTKLCLIDYWNPNSLFNIRELKLNKNMSKARIDEIKQITKRYKENKRIEIDNTDILVHAFPIIGQRYKINSQHQLESEIQWSKKIEVYPYQMIVRNMNVSASGFTLHKTVEQIFTIHSICFMMKPPHYGTTGEIVEPGYNRKTGRVSIAMKITQEPNFDEISTNQDVSVEYVHDSTAAAELKISDHFFKRITGTIFIENDENSDENPINIGLNLKFNKINEEVPGYTKRENGVWLYSAKTIELVKEYIENNPELYARLNKKLSLNMNTFKKSELFATGSTELDEVLKWLKKQATRKLERCACDSKLLTPSHLKKTEDIVINYTKSNRNIDETVMNLKPVSLFVPGLTSRDLPIDLKAQHRLLDRVVCVRNNFTVPLGYKGTIVGIHEAENPLDNIYSVLFDKEFVGGHILKNCKTHRGYRLSIIHFLNISHGLRLEQSPKKNPTHLRQQSESSNKLNIPKENNQQRSRIEVGKSEQQNKRGFNNQNQSNALKNENQGRSKTEAENFERQNKPRFNKHQPNVTKNENQQRSKTESGRFEQNKRGFNKQHQLNAPKNENQEKSKTETGHFEQQNKRGFNNQNQSNSLKNENQGRSKTETGNFEQQNKQGFNKQYSAKNFQHKSEGFRQIKPDGNKNETVNHNKNILKVNLTNEPKNEHNPRKEFQKKIPKESVANKTHDESTKNEWIAVSRKKDNRSGNSKVVDKKKKNNLQQKSSTHS